MKREKFIIKANGVIFDTRRAWNTGIRSIEAKVKDFANAEGQNFKLVESVSEKDEYGFNYCKGHRVWASQSSIVKFTIEREDHATSAITA